MVEEGWPIDFVYSPELTPRFRSQHQWNEPEERNGCMVWSTGDHDVPQSQQIVVLVIDDFGPVRFTGRPILEAAEWCAPSGPGQDARFQLYLGGRQFLDRAFQE